MRIKVNYNRWSGYTPLFAYKNSEDNKIHLITFEVLCNYYVSKLKKLVGEEHE